MRTLMETLSLMDKMRSLLWSATSLSSEDTSPLGARGIRKENWI